MKNFIITICLFFTSVFAFAQQSSGSEVLITRNAGDVKGLLKICPVNEIADGMFSGQVKLTEKAIASAKKKAAAKSANIIFIEKESFSTTPYNNVNIVGWAYLSSKIMENQIAIGGIDTSNCDFVRRELKLYMEKYGDLQTTQSAVVNNLNNGVDFNIISIDGDIKNQTVTVNFYLYTRKPNQAITLTVGYGDPSKATDINGNQYSATLGILGDTKHAMFVSNKLSTDTKLKGSMRYSGILSNVTQMSLITIYTQSSNFDGGQNSAQGTIDIKNVDINWR